MNMRKAGLVVVLAMLAACGGARSNPETAGSALPDSPKTTDTGGDPLNGKPAPALEGKAVGAPETNLSLAGLKGKVVLVVFFASWSPPGIDRLTAVEAMVAKHSKAGLVAIAVAADDEVGDVEGFLKRRKPVSAAIPVLWDSGHGFSKTWNDAPPPATFIIDRTGVVRKGWRWIREGLDKTIADEVAKFL